MTYSFAVWAQSEPESTPASDDNSTQASETPANAEEAAAGDPPAASAPAAGDDGQRSENPQKDGEQKEIDLFSQAKVYSCAIDFPLDSVQFNEKRMEDCFKGIQLERISYIHVIATATVTGSHDHNLYLSTRRAGAIEGYLQNRFPDVTIHAFGGGKNPKFGKSARIFIVESPPNPDQETPEQKVVVEQYPQVKVEVRTRIKYREREKIGLGIRALGGLSNFRDNDSAYQFVGIATTYDVNAPFLGPLALGLRYTLNRSNKVLDIHEGMFVAEKAYRLPLGLRNGSLSLGVQGLAGASYQDTVDPNFGGAGILRYTVKDYSSALNAGYSKHFRWVGLEMGVLL